MKPTYSSSNSCSCTACMELNRSERTSSLRIVADDSRTKRNFRKCVPSRERSVLENTIPTYGDFKNYHYFDSESSQFNDSQWTRPSLKQRDNIEKNSAILELVNLVDNASTLGSKKLSASCSWYSYSTVGNDHVKNVRKNSKYLKATRRMSRGTGRYSTSASSLSKLKMSFKTKHIRSAPCTCTFSSLIKSQPKTIINKLRAKVQVNKFHTTNEYYQESEFKGISGQIFDSQLNEKSKLASTLEKQNLKNSKDAKSSGNSRCETQNPIEKRRSKKLKHRVADVQTSEENFEEKRMSKVGNGKAALQKMTGSTFPEHVDKGVKCINKATRNNKIQTHDHDKSAISVATTISFDKMTAVNVKVRNSVAINVAALWPIQNSKNNYQGQYDNNKDTVLNKYVKSMTYLPIVSSKVSSESTSTCSITKMKTEKSYESRNVPESKQILQKSKRYQPFECINQDQQCEVQPDLFRKRFSVNIPSYQTNDVSFSSSSCTSKGMQSQITQADLSSRSNRNPEQILSKGSSFKMKFKMNKNIHPSQIKKNNDINIMAQLNDNDKLLNERGRIEPEIFGKDKEVREHMHKKRSNTDNCKIEKLSEEQIILNRTEKVNQNKSTKDANTSWIDDTEKSNMNDYQSSKNLRKNSTTLDNTKKQRNGFSDILKQCFYTFKFNTFAKAKKMSKEVVVDAANESNHKHITSEMSTKANQIQPKYIINPHWRQSNVCLPEKSGSCSYPIKNKNCKTFGKSKLNLSANPLQLKSKSLKKQFLASGTNVDSSAIMRDKHFQKTDKCNSNTYNANRANVVLSCDIPRSEVNSNCGTNVNNLPIVREQEQQYPTPPSSKNMKTIQNTTKVKSKVIFQSKDIKQTQKSGIQIMLKKCLRSLPFGKKEVHNSADQKDDELENTNCTANTRRKLEITETKSQCLSGIYKQNSHCVHDYNLSKKISKDKGPHRLPNPINLSILKTSSSQVELKQNDKCNSKHKLSDTSLYIKQGLSDLFINEILDNQKYEHKKTKERMKNNSVNNKRSQVTYFAPFSRQYVTMNIQSTRDRKEDSDRKPVEYVRYECNPNECQKKIMRLRRTVSSTSSTTTEKSGDREKRLGDRTKSNFVKVKPVKQNILHKRIQPERQPEREESNFSFNLHLSKKAHQADTDYTVNSQSRTKLASKYNNETRDNKRELKSQAVQSNTGLSPVLKRCYCTLEFKKNGKQKISVVKSVSQTIMDVSRKKKQYVRTQGTTTSSDDIAQEIQFNGKNMKLSKRQCMLDPYVLEPCVFMAKEYYPSQDVKHLRSNKRYAERGFTAKSLAHSAATVTVQKATRRQKQPKYESARSLREKTDHYVSPKRQVVKIGSTFSFSIEFSRLPPAEEKSHKRALLRSSTGTITDTDTRHVSSLSGTSSQCLCTLKLRNQRHVPESKYEHVNKRKKQKMEDEAFTKNEVLLRQVKKEDYLYANNIPTYISTIRRLPGNTHAELHAQETKGKRYLHGRRRIYNSNSQTGLTKNEDTLKTNLKRCFCALSLQKPGTDILKIYKNQTEPKTFHLDAKSVSEIKTKFLRPYHSASFSSTLDSNFSLRQRKSQSTSVRSRIQYDDEYEKLPNQLSSHVNLNTISSEQIYNYLLNKRYSVARKLRNKENMQSEIKESSFTQNSTNVSRNNTDSRNSRQEVSYSPEKWTSLTGMSPYLKSNFYAFKVTKEKSTTSSKDAKKDSKKSGKKQKSKSSKKDKDKEKKPKLEPYECEPGVCVPGECDPHECLKRIEERNKRLKISDKGKRPVERKDLPDLEPFASRNMQTITPKRRNLRCGPTRYLVEEPRFQKGVSKMPRGLRVTSSVKLNIELYSDALPPIGERPPDRFMMRRDTFTQSDDLDDKKTGGGICFRHRGLQTGPYKPRYPVSTGTGQVSAIKRCFCTLKLLKSSLEELPLLEVKNQQTSADMQEMPGLHDRNTSAQFPLPVTQADTGVGSDICKQIECEPGTCIPEECDPKECLKRIKRRHRQQNTLHNRHKMTLIPEDSHVICGEREEDDLERPAVRIASEIGFTTKFYSENPYSMRQRDRDRRRRKRELRCEDECPAPPPPKETKDKGSQDPGAPHRDSTAQSVPKKETKGTGILKRCFCTLKLTNPQQQVHYMSVDVNSPLYVAKDGDLYQLKSNRYPESYRQKLSELKYTRQLPVRQSAIHKGKHIKRDERPIVSYAQFQIPPRVITVGRVVVDNGKKKYLSNVVNKSKSRYKISNSSNIYVQHYREVSTNHLESKPHSHEMETIYPYIPNKFNNNNVESKTLMFKNQNKCEFYSFPIYKLSSRCHHVMKTENKRYIRKSDKTKHQKKKQLRIYLTGQREAKPNYDADIKMEKALHRFSYSLENNPKAINEQSGNYQNELKHLYKPSSRHVPFKVDKRDRYPRVKKHNHIKVYRPDVLKYINERRITQPKGRISPMIKSERIGLTSEKALYCKDEHYHNLQPRYMNEYIENKMTPRIYKRDNVFCYYQTQFKLNKTLKPENKVIMPLSDKEVILSLLSPKSRSTEPCNPKICRVNDCLKRSNIMSCIHKTAEAESNGKSSFIFDKRNSRKISTKVDEPIEKVRLQNFETNDAPEYKEHEVLSNVNRYDKDKNNKIRGVTYPCPIKRHKGSKPKPGSTPPAFLPREGKKKTSDFVEEIEHKPNMYKLSKLITTSDTSRLNKVVKNISNLKYKDLAAICKLNGKPCSICHFLNKHHSSLIFALDKRKKKTKKLADEVHINKKAAKIRSKRATLKHKSCISESEKCYIDLELFREALKTQKQSSRSSIRGNKISEKEILYQNIQKKLISKKALNKVISAKKKENRVKKKNKHELQKRQKKKQQKKFQKKKLRISDQKTEKQLRKLNASPDAAVDAGKLGFSILRSILRKIIHPWDTYKSIKSAYNNPSEISSMMKNVWYDSSATTDNHNIIKRKILKSSQKLKKTLDRSRTRSLLMHILDTEPKRRLKLMKKRFYQQGILRKRGPLDFECSLFMASQQKRPCLKVPYMCPWFYQHCLNVLKVWRHFTDVILFILAVVVWSPCILCTYLYRAVKCCTV